MRRQAHEALRVGTTDTGHAWTVRLGRWSGGDPGAHVALEEVRRAGRAVSGVGSHAP